MNDCKQITKYIPYSRARFSTRLPENFLYTASHFWLYEVESKIWQVGFTKFAIRMLGEIVEQEFNVATNEQVDLGQVIGWVEGFKAISDLYCILSGNFNKGNHCLLEDPNIMYSDPYRKGWLYEVKGVPESHHFNVQGYIDYLDMTIDKLLQSQFQEQ